MTPQQFIGKYTEKLMVGEAQRLETEAMELMKRDGWEAQELTVVTYADGRPALVVPTCQLNAQP